VVSAAIVKMLWIGGISIAVSMAVAVLIRMMVALGAHVERVARRGSPPEARVCPVGPGISDEDVAVVSAALYAAIGPHRVVHLAEAGRGRAWVSEGRASHHTSHAPTHRPKH
jgi:hypothetical protein